MSNRRRAHSQSDEEDYDSRKRRRNNHSIELRLETLICHLGEKSELSLENNIEGITNVVEADMHSCKSKIMKIFIKCITELPEKLTIYTTLVGLLNVRQHHIGQELLDILMRTLKEYMRDGVFEKARMIIRFFSDLVNCNVVSSASIIALYNNILDAMFDEDSTQARSDWYAYSLMSALPWVAGYLSESLPVEFNKIISLLSKYIEKREKSYLKLIQIWPSKTEHEQEEYIDCLWAMLCSLKESGWTEKTLSRPYIAFDNILWGPDRRGAHTLPSFPFSLQREDRRFPLPSAVFRLFDYTDCPGDQQSLPGSHSIDRFLIEERVKFLIYRNYKERKECATALLNLSTKHKLPINYIIVEVVFGEMLVLPRSKYLQVFYGSLFIELCKQLPEAVPQVLAQASEMLFDRIQSMTAVAANRFSSWFAYHLSNFQYRWCWDDWKSSVNVEDSMDKKPTFIREVLLKCLRMSYHKRIISMVPEFLYPLVPQPPEAVNKYELNKSLPGSMTAQHVNNCIRTRGVEVDKVYSLLENIPDAPVDQSIDGKEAHEMLKIDIFVQTLLAIASKSFSHSFAAILKYRPVLRQLASGENSEIQVLTSLYEVWCSHQQSIVVHINKLIKINVVSSSSVVVWIFSPAMAHEFTNFFIWEILNQTLSYSQREIDSMQNNLYEAKDIVEEFQLRLQEEEDEDEDVEDDDETRIKRDVPTEDDIQGLTNDVDCARGEQKNLFLILFQKFIIALSEHIIKNESNYKNSWYIWTIERMQEVFLTYHEVIYKHRRILRETLFTSNIDNRIVEVFNQFCALKL